MRTDGSIAFWASYTDLVFLSQTDENHKGLSEVLQGWPKTKTLLQKECLHSLGLFHFKKQQLQKTWHNPQACKGTHSLITSSSPRGRVTVKALRGRVSTTDGSGSSQRAVCGNSSPQDVTSTQSLQDARGDWTSDLLGVTKHRNTFRKSLNQKLLEYPWEMLLHFGL